MKPIKIIVLAASMAFIAACSSCENNPFSDCKDDYYFEYDNLFGFYLFDYYTGKNLLEIGVNIYQRDSVKVYDEDAEIRFNGPVDNDGFILFKLVREDQDFNIPDLTFHKEFFLYLNQYDTDTMVFDFTMAYDSKCREQNMTFMKIQYNDSIYFDKPTNRVASQILHKK